MFIRRKHAKGKTYYSLVDNRRDETGKVKQRHVMHLPTPFERERTYKFTDAERAERKQQAEEVERRAGELANKGEKNSSHVGGNLFVKADDLRKKPSEPIYWFTDSAPSVNEAIQWYTVDFNKAKDTYRRAVTSINDLRRAYDHEGYRYIWSDFEEFELLRAEVFKWYRIIQTLKGAPTGCYHDTEAANETRRKTLEEKQRMHRRLKLLDRGVSMETIIDKGDTI